MGRLIELLLESQPMATNALKLKRDSTNAERNTKFWPKKELKVGKSIRAESHEFIAREGEKLLERT